MPRNRLMRTASSLACLGMGAALLFGCDDGAASRAEFNRNYEAVLAEFHAAQRQLGTTISESGDIGAFGVERDESLQAVIGKLEGLSRQGEPAQQALARRLLADAQASRAEHLLRNAQIAWAGLGADAAALQERAIALASIGERVNITAYDESSLRETIVSGDTTQESPGLRGGIEPTRAEVQRLQSEADDLQARVDDLEEQIQSLRDRASRQFVRAREISDDAFVASEPERSELLEQSDEVRREGERLNTRADGLIAQQALLESRLRITRRSLGVASEQLDAWEAGLTSVDERQSQRQQQRTQLEAEREQAAIELNNAMEAYLAQYEQRVAAPLREAEQALESGLETLRSAGGLSNSQRAVLDGKRLAMHTIHARVLAHHIQYSAGRVDVLETVARLIAQVPIEQSRRQTLNDALEQAEQSVESLATRADGVVSEAMGLYTELEQSAPAESAQASALAQYRKSLAMARERIDAARATADID